MLRVGGRLHRTLLDYDRKHHLIFPGDCPLAQRIIEDTHSKILHGDVQLTLGTIRRQDRLLNGYQAVKKVIGQRIPCVPYSAQQYSQLMGQLPQAHAAQSFPFSRSEVNYAGSETDVRVPRKATFAFCLSSNASYTSGVGRRLHQFLDSSRSTLTIDQPKSTVLLK